MEQKFYIDKKFTVIWVVWGLLLFVAEFFWPCLIKWFPIIDGSWQRSVPWLVSIIYFMFFEFKAIRREAKGDTLSEQIWRFLSGKPARIPLVVGFVALICIRLYEFGLNLGIEEFDLARWLFIIGLFGTLVLHFIFLGRKG